MTSQNAVEQTRRCLNNIERFDPIVNAFISVLAESALSEAEAIDRARGQGAVGGLLAGVPISVKDCIDVAGTPCTNGSTFFADYVPEKVFSRAWILANQTPVVDEGTPL